MQSTVLAIFQKNEFNIYHLFRMHLSFKIDLSYVRSYFKL